MKRLSLETAKGAMMVLLNSNIKDVVGAIGCTESDWKLVIGKKPWLGVDRPRVMRVLDGLLYGMVDQMGLPRFELPAEFAASVVALFVSPVNHYASCVWMGKFARGEDLGNAQINTEPVEGLELVSAKQLFALILMIVSGENIACLVGSFSAKCDLQLGYVLDKSSK